MWRGDAVIWPIPNLVAWLALAVGLLLGAGVQQIRVQTYRADLQHEQAIRATLQADLAAATIKAQQDVERERQSKAAALAALDTTTTEELTHARKDNDRLRAAVRAGTDRLRIVGAYCAAPSGAVPQAPGASGVGDAAAQLGPALQERVLDLRQAVIDAEAQISYLQGYARECAR